MASLLHRITAVTPQDERFYQALGQRLASHRKAAGLTQVVLAERLGVSQQTLAHYEGGRLRISVAMLTAAAKELGAAVEELLGQAAKKGNGKRGPAPKLQRQIDQIRQLPRSRQRFVMDMLDTVIRQESGG